MKKNSLTANELSDLCLEFSLLLHAGVGGADALNLLAEGENDDTVKEMLFGAAEQVDAGISVSCALRETRAFPSYVCGLLEVGERTGRTEEALAALSHYYESRAQMENRIRNALLYPAVMLYLMLAVIGVLLVKVLPIFDDVYRSLGGRLTGVAGGLLVAGRAIDAAMPVLWVLLAAAVVLALLLALSASFRTKLTAAWRNKYGDRGLFRQINNARMAQAMAMGMRSGLPVEEAITLAAGLMEDFPAARQRCLDCRARLDEGAPLGRAMGEAGLLEPSQCRLLELSQRSGFADSAMERVAERLSEDSGAALENRVNRVEPALVLVCSILVGLILLSVMLPLMHIMAAIG